MAIDYRQKQNGNMPLEAETYQKGYKYSGSDNASDVAWHYDNSDMKSHVVKTKMPNELGIYDMSGNICEWCWDRMGNEYPNTIKDYTGPETGDSRVCRGGGFYLNDTNTSVEHRIDYQPYVSCSYFGFRVVRSSRK